MQTYRRKPGILETEVENEMVLLDPESQAMFSLNSVGRVIWRQLEGSNVDDVTERVMEKFEIDEQTARSDARELLDELVKAGLTFEVPA